MDNESKFRAFIQEQLKIAKINQEHRESFTDSDGLKLFLAAFTHPTFDPENNYQELEFIGDGIIKGILSQYIPRRFPKLASGGSKYSKKGTGEGVLSKTRRFLEQRKTLSDFGLKLGYWDFVLADEETKAKSRKETLEDVFEAFVGALVEIVDQRIKRGLGYNYAYNYVEASLDDMEIEISKKTLDDPITRLNELYKANELKNNKPPLKWGDAAYEAAQLYVPKLADKPKLGVGANPKTVNAGEVFFSTKDKIAYVWDGKGWVHISRAPLLNLKPFPVDLPPPVEGEYPENIQMLWYAGVYGFPNKLGKALDGSLDKITPKLVLEDPDKYDADIIGQGLHFKKVDSKKIAATQALQYLAHRGFKK